jgi:hypothetical protein
MLGDRGNGHRVDLRATICKSHEPRLQSARLPLDLGNTYAERKALEGFYVSQYAVTVTAGGRRRTYDGKR